MSQFCINAEKEPDRSQALALLWLIVVGVNDGGERGTILQKIVLLIYLCNIFLCLDWIVF